MYRSTNMDHGCNNNIHNSTCVCCKGLWVQVMNVNVLFKCTLRERSSFNYEPPSMNVWLQACTISKKEVTTTDHLGSQTELAVPLHIDPEEGCTEGRYVKDTALMSITCMWFIVNNNKIHQTLRNITQALKWSSPKTNFLDHRVFSFISSLPYCMVRICLQWPCMNTYHTLYYRLLGVYWLALCAV